MNFVSVVASRRLRVFMGSLACSLVAVSSIAEADTSVRKSTVYFTVRGKTASELDNALMRGGPQVGGMARHPGAAQIKFSGDIKYNESKGRCSVGVARVNLNLKIILPNWQDRPGAGRGLAVLWDSLSGDIKRHEERHAEIATQHAHQLEQALKNLPPQKNCQDMQALVAKTTDQQIALHDADQRRFDEVEMANFEARVMRLIKERTAQLEANAK